MKSEHARAAAEIRKALKAHNIPAKVRSEAYSGGTSIRVKLTGDPLPATIEAVRAATAKYQYGHFDGMTDMYEISNRNDDVPQVKFLFVDVDYSDELQQAAWDYCRAHHVTCEGAPEDFRSIHDHEQRVCLSQLMSEQWGNFWTARKERRQERASVTEARPQLRVVK